MNDSAATLLKSIKRSNEAGAYSDAYLSASRAVFGAGTHEKAMFYHRAAMAAEWLGLPEQARAYYDLAQAMFDELESRDEIGLAILHRDWAMFEMRQAPFARRQDVLDLWLPIIEQDCRGLKKLDQDPRVAKELRVTIGFVTRLRWRVHPGDRVLIRQLIIDFEEIARLCEQDGTKPIYVLDGLDEIIRSGGLTSPLAPNRAVVRAAVLSFDLGNRRRGLRYLIAEPTKYGLYAGGSLFLRSFGG